MGSLFSSQPTYPSGLDLWFPTVYFRSSRTFKHQSSFDGIESSSAKYIFQGRDIAERLASDVSEKLKTLRASYWHLPKCPQVLYPKFQAAPKFEFLDRLGASRHFAGHGLMRYNESLWQFASSENAESLLNSIRDELQSSGWGVSLTLEGHVYLEAVNGAEVIEVSLRQGGSFLSTQNKEPLGPDIYHVRYMHFMDRNQLEAVVSEILSSPQPDFQTLLLLRQFWQADTQKMIMGLAQSHPPRSIDVWLSLAKISDDQDFVRRCLVRANTLLRTVRNAESFQARIKELAKARKIEESLLQESDRSALAELGVVELVIGADPTVVEISRNSNASFFVADPPMAILCLPSSSMATSTTYETHQLD